MLTYEKAVATTEEILAEYGEDFVYRAGNDPAGCFYAPIGEVKELAAKGIVGPISTFEGSPPEVISFNGIKIDENSNPTKTGCLIGEILRRNNMLTDEIKACGNTISQLIANNIIVVDSNKTKRFLASMQGNQDTGSPWGEAYAEAKSLSRSTETLHHF